MPEDLPGYSDNSELFRGLFTSFGDKPFVGVSAGVWTHPIGGVLRRTVQWGMPDSWIPISGESSMEDREPGAAVRNRIRLEHWSAQAVRDLSAAQRCSWRSGSGDREIGTPDDTPLHCGRMGSVCDGSREWCGEEPVYPSQAEL